MCQRLAADSSTYNLPAKNSGTAILWLTPLMIALVSLLSLGIPESSAAADSPNPRPNVLLILTDDQGYGDLSLHGNPHLETPRLDQLGRESVRFDRFYVNSFCAPSRAGILTGRWPLRCGVHGVTHNKEAMKSEEVTLGEAFQSAGYQTGYFGKWHNGEQFPHTPPGQGFEQFLGFNNGHWNNYFDAELLSGSQPEATRGYISDVLTDAAIRFVESPREQPFFCYLSFNAPHSPYQVPDRYYDKYRAQGFDETVSAFYGMCENIDDNVGRLLDKLDQLQLTGDTIVLFMTDNGGTAGVKIYNAGMRGGKVSVHEGGSRVPLFVRWPAAEWQPKSVDTITAHIDLYPTLIDLCNITPPSGPPVDGRSLRPLLEQERPAWPERTLFTHNPINETNRYPGAVRTQRYRLVRLIKGPSGGSNARENDNTAQPWKLFDMQHDPGENHNIAAQHPELVEQLSAQYEQWYDDISSAGVRRLPIPIGFAEHNPVELHAPQAYFDSPLNFASGPGYANDWLSNWTDPQARIWFEIDVVNPGTYTVEIAYARSSTEPIELRLNAGQASCQQQLTTAPPRAVELPHRDEPGRLRYRNRDWATTALGQLKLTKDDQRLQLSVATPSGDEVIDFKHLRLKRIGD